MFENIIGYKHHTEHWQHLIQGNTLPAGLCISGQSCAGRCSCALEVSRGILCQESGAWNCSCADCVYMRLLEHENLLMLGSRNFLSELYCADFMVEKHQDMQTHMVFYRALKKLVRRADEMLWEGTGLWTRGIKTAVEGVHDALKEWREFCFEYAQKKEPRDARVLEKTLTQRKRKALVRHAEKLQEALPVYLYPVHVLRNVISWAHIRSHGNAKIIILESAERLLEASSNILLKTLEEPPQQVFFMFITSHVSSLLPTIVSRLRSYVLPMRSVEEERQVIEKVFRNSDAQLYARSVAEFLANFTKQENTEQGKVAAEHYLNASIQGKPFDARLMELLQGASSANGAKVFIENVQELLRAQLLTTAVPSQVIHAFARDCAQTLHAITTRNVSALMALEALYYTFAEHAKLYAYEKILTHGAA